MAGYVLVCDEVADTADGGGCLYSHYEPWQAAATGDFWQLPTQWQIDHVFFPIMVAFLGATMLTLLTAWGVRHLLFEVK